MGWIPREIERGARGQVSQAAEAIATPGMRSQLLQSIYNGAWMLAELGSAGMGPAMREIRTQSPELKEAITGTAAQETSMAIERAAFDTQMDPTRIREELIAAQGAAQGTAKGQREGIGGDIARATGQSLTQFAAMAPAVALGTPVAGAALASQLYLPGSTYTAGALEYIDQMNRDRAEAAMEGRDLPEFTLSGMRDYAATSALINTGVEMGGAAIGGKIIGKIAKGATASKIGQAALKPLIDRGMPIVERAMVSKVGSKGLQTFARLSENTLEFRNGFFGKALAMGTTSGLEEGGEELVTAALMAPFTSAPLSEDIANGLYSSMIGVAAGGVGGTAPIGAFAVRQGIVNRADAMRAETDRERVLRQIHSEALQRKTNWTKDLTEEQNARLATALDSVNGMDQEQRGTFLRELGDRRVDIRNNVDNLLTQRQQLDIGLTGVRDLAENGTDEEKAAAKDQEAQILGQIETLDEQLRLASSDAMMADAQYSAVAEKIGEMPATIEQAQPEQVLTDVSTRAGVELKPVAMPKNGRRAQAQVEALGRKVVWFRPSAGTFSPAFHSMRSRGVVYMNADAPPTNVLANALEEVFHDIQMFQPELAQVFMDKAGLMPVYQAGVAYAAQGTKESAGKAQLDKAAIAQAESAVSELAGEGATVSPEVARAGAARIEQEGTANAFAAAARATGSGSILAPLQQFAARRGFLGRDVMAAMAVLDAASRAAAVETVEGTKPVATLSPLARTLLWANDMNLDFKGELDAAESFARGELEPKAAPKTQTERGPSSAAESTEPTPADDTAIKQVEQELIADEKAKALKSIKGIVEFARDRGDDMVSFNRLPDESIMERVESGELKFVGAGPNMVQEPTYLIHNTDEQKMDPYGRRKTGGMNSGLSLTNLKQRIGTFGSNQIPFYVVSSNPLFVNGNGSYWGRIPLNLLPKEFADFVMAETNRTIDATISADDIGTQALKFGYDVIELANIEDDAGLHNEIIVTGRDNLVSPATGFTLEQMDVDLWRNQNGIPPYSSLTKIRDLGGSTGAALFEDPDGGRWVVKTNATQDHLKNEWLAFQLYRDLGITDLPENGIDAAPTKSRARAWDKTLTDTAYLRQVMLTKFIDAPTLGKFMEDDDISDKDKESVRQILSDQMMFDAVMRNWDVVGMDLDNIVVKNLGSEIAPAYMPVRIDLGGTLNYRAQGGKKDGLTHRGVQETLYRLQGSAQGMFSLATPESLAKQLLTMLNESGAVLEMNESASAFRFSKELHLDVVFGTTPWRTRELVVNERIESRLIEFGAQRLRRILRGEIIPTDSYQRDPLNIPVNNKSGEKKLEMAETIDDLRAIEFDVPSTANDLTDSNIELAKRLRRSLDSEDRAELIKIANSEPDNGWKYVDIARKARAILDRKATDTAVGAALKNAIASAAKAYQAAVENRRSQIRDEVANSEEMAALKNSGNVQITSNIDSFIDGITKFRFATNEWMNTPEIVAAEDALKRAQDDLASFLRRYPEQRANASVAEISYARPSDTDYLAAVERGDMEAAQRMVDLVARLAGYTVGPVYHGTKRTFKSFESNRDPNGLIYFSEDPKFARSYAIGSGGHREPEQNVQERIDAAKAQSRALTKPLYAQLEEQYGSWKNIPDEEAVAVLDRGRALERELLDGMTAAQAQMEMGVRVINAYLRAPKIFFPTESNIDEYLPIILKNFGVQSFDELKETTKKYIRAGHYLVWESPELVDLILQNYDAIRLAETEGKPAQTIAVRNNTQIKSADPVTYDEQGNIVPLSQRFDTSRAEISYARPAEDPEVTALRQQIEDLKRQMRDVQNTTAAQRVNALREVRVLERKLSAAQLLAEQKVGQAARSAARLEIQKQVNRDAKQAAEEAAATMSKDLESARATVASLRQQLREAKSNADTEDLLREAEKKLDRVANWSYAIGRNEGLVAGQVAGIQQERREQLRVIKPLKERLPLVEARLAKATEDLRAARKQIAQDERSAQKAVDFAYQLGLRSGQVQGMMRGRQVLLRKMAQREDTLQRQLTGLRDLMATKVTNLESLRAAISQIATDAARTLPVRLRGPLAVRIANAKTLGQANRIAVEATKLAINEEVSSTLKTIARLKKQMNKRGMKYDTRVQIETLLRDADAALRQANRRRIYASVGVMKNAAGKSMGAAILNAVNVYSQVADAAAKVDAALVLYTNDAAAFKAEKQARVAKYQADTAALVANMQGRPTLPMRDRTDQPVRTSLARRIRVANSDIYTLQLELEGKSDGIINKLLTAAQQGKGASALEHAAIIRQLEPLLQAAGYTGLDDYALKNGMLGQTIVNPVTVTLGGRNVTIPVGTMLSIAAMDDETLNVFPKAGEPLTQGIRFPGSRTTTTIYPTREEIIALKASLTPGQQAFIDGMKSILETQIRDRTMDAIWKIEGDQPPIVQNYWPRIRDMAGFEGESAGVLNQAGALVRGALTSVGFANARTGGNRPFLYSDAFQTWDRHIQVALDMIHMAQPYRDAATVLSDQNVVELIDRQMGAGTANAVLSIFSNGVGATARTNATIIDKLTNNVTGAVLSLSPRTWAKVQTGGIIRLASEVGPVYLAEGTAKTTAMLRSPQMWQARVEQVHSQSGYFTHRHQMNMRSIMSGTMSEQDRIKVMTAAKAVYKSIAAATDSSRAANFTDTLNSLGNAQDNANIVLSSLVDVLRAIDENIMLTAVEARLAEAKDQGYVGAAAFTVAVERAEQDFRRSQNSSDEFDETAFAAETRTSNKSPAWRMLFPFSSDTLKARNQIRRAWLSGERRAGTALAIGGNLTTNAVINAASVMTLLYIAKTISSVLGGADEPTDEEDKAFDKAVKELPVNVASELTGQVGGYVGIALQGVITAAMYRRAPMQALVTRPLEQATREVGKISGEDGSWAYLAPAILAVAQLRGVPAYQLYAFVAKQIPEAEKTPKEKLQKRLESIQERFSPEEIRKRVLQRAKNAGRVSIPLP
jgi:hypothetical protein